MFFKTFVMKKFLCGLSIQNIFC